MKYSNLLNASQELLEGRIELSFNGLGLAEGGGLEAQSFNLAQCLIVVQMFNKPLMPCFCKALVMGSTVFNTRF